MARWLAKPKDTVLLDEIYQFASDINERIVKLPLKHTATFPIRLPGDLPNQENYFTVKTLDTKPSDTIRGYVFVQEPTTLKNKDVQPKEIIIVFNPPSSFYVAAGCSKNREQKFDKIKSQLVAQVIEAIQEARKHAGEDAEFNLTIAGASLAGQDMQYMTTALIEAILEEAENNKRENLEKIRAINMIGANATKGSKAHAERAKELVERLKFAKWPVALNNYNLIDVEKPHNWVGENHSASDWPATIANVHARVQVGADSKSAVDLNNHSVMSRHDLKSRLNQHSVFVESRFFRIIYTITDTLRNVFKGMFRK